MKPSPTFAYTLNFVKLMVFKTALSGKINITHYLIGDDDDYGDRSFACSVLHEFDGSHGFSNPQRQNEIAHPDTLIRGW